MGVCALKMPKFACLLLWSVLALAGCRSDNNSTASIGGTSSTPANLPTGTGNATLSWEAPTTTTAGATLTNLAGYRIYYGINQDDLAATVQLAGVGLQTYVVDNLGQGTWYFAVKAVTSAGIESSLSNIVSKTIN